MKYPIRRREAAAYCDLCDAPLLPDDLCYRINGETICPDCLGEYARQVFAPYREAAGGRYPHA
jgi:hypothetical protein